MSDENVPGTDPLMRKIVLGKQSRIDACADYCQAVLLAVGYFHARLPQAWIEQVLITDESTFSDFLLTSPQLECLSVLLGAPLTRSTPLVNIAEHLQSLDEEPEEHI